MRREIFQADAFTTEPFTGNPAGVVLDATGLTDAQMQSIAREMNNPETAFVFPPQSPDASLAIRYFTPTTEVPICGHATIAAHHVRAVTDDLPSGIVYQRSAVGVLPIEIERAGSDCRITMTQGPIGFSDPLPATVTAAIADALGLARVDMLDLPVQVVTTGHSKVIIGAGTRDTLARLSPDMAALTRISRHIGCNGYFVFTLDAPDEGAASTARMFAPAIGIPEDPVTGNGNGPFGAYCVRHRLLPWSGGELDFRGTQGHMVGRRGVVRVRVQVDADANPVKVRVGEDAVIVFRAEFRV